VPLIRSLGLKHPGVLDLLGDFPEGSDKLVLKMLEVLAAKAKLPSDILALIKQVAAKRDLDSQFYLLILPECHKVCSAAHQECDRFTETFSSHRTRSCDISRGSWPCSTGHRRRRRRFGPSSYPSSRRQPTSARSTR
jgi:hypothetical protein